MCIASLHVWYIVQKVTAQLITVVEEILIRLPESWRSGKVGLQTMDPEAMFQAVDANPTSSTRRVSGELGIFQSNVVHHLHNIDKSIWSPRIVHHVLPKYCKTFDST